MFEVILMLVVIGTIGFFIGYMIRERRVEKERKLNIKKAENLLMAYFDDEYIKRQVYGESSYVTAIKLYNKLTSPIFRSGKKINDFMSDLSEIHSDIDRTLLLGTDSNIGLGQYDKQLFEYIRRKLVRLRSEYIKDYYSFESGLSSVRLRDLIKDMGIVRNWALDPHGDGVLWGDEPLTPELVDSKKNQFQQNYIRQILDTYQTRKELGDWTYAEMQDLTEVIRSIGGPEKMEASAKLYDNICRDMATPIRFPKEESVLVSQDEKVSA